MTADLLLVNLAARGVSVTADGGSIELDAEAGVLTDDDLRALKDQKRGVLRLLRLAEGSPVDESASRLLAMDQLAPSDLPICATCGRLSDTETMDSAWHCSRCDTSAKYRHEETQRWLRNAETIRNYHQHSNG